MGAEGGTAARPKPKIIINAQRAPEDLQETLRSAGFEGEIALAGPNLERAARDAVKQGPQMIVAGGGDGTVSTVAAAVAGTECVLGVLPLGTFNNFARDLGIPLDIPGAARVLAAGHMAEIDAAEVNGHVFINNSGIGVYPWLVEQRERHEREGRGRLGAFLRAAIAAARRYPFVDVTLEAEGVQLRRRTPFVFVGNNEYRMEGLRMARRDSIAGGTLSLAVAHRTGRAGMVRLALSALIGRLQAASDFDMITAGEIRIDTRRPTARVSLDGEVLRLETPLHYRILPRALRIIVPEGR